MSPASLTGKMSGLSAPWRGLRLLIHLLTAFVLVATAIAPARTLGRYPAWIAALTTWWYRHLCRILGLRLKVEGKPEPGVLLVANHVSWIDILVLGAQADVCFLSKAEIRAWPLIGWMAAILGTLFIHRGAHEAGAMANQIAARIREGRLVALFPEATTSDGSRLLPFHPRLFAAAQVSGARLQAVALRYGEAGRLDPIAPFTGDAQAMPHLWRVLHHPGIRVQVQFLPSFASQGLERKAMATACRETIASALGLGQGFETTQAGRVPGRTDAAPLRHDPNPGN